MSPLRPFAVSFEMRWSKIVTISSTLAVNLREKLLRRLRYRKSDTPYIIETLIRAEITYDPDLAEQIAVAEDVMHGWRDVLRKLGE